MFYKSCLIRISQRGGESLKDLLGHPCCTFNILKHVLKPGYSSNIYTIAVSINCKIERGIWSQAPFLFLTLIKVNMERWTTKKRNASSQSAHRCRDIKIKRSQIGHTHDPVYPSLSVATSIAATI